MELDDEILELKKSYELWQSIDIKLEYGPLRYYSTINHKTVHNLWGKISHIIEKYSMPLNIEDGIPKFRLPSPWHAYFVLKMAHTILYRANRECGLNFNEDDAKYGEHLFFRGQRCSSWEFISSLMRKDNQSRIIENRAVIALKEYFSQHFGHQSDITSNISRCFAQHYGIATDLIDITCSPDIAIWFATHPTNRECPKNEEYGIVRGFGWLWQNNCEITKILMPPPFINNLYTQRGLFIDATKTGGIIKGNTLIEAMFTRDTCGGEFKVRRNNQFIDVWPDIDKSEIELIEWARKIAIDASNNKNIRILIKKDKKNHSLPDFWLKKEIYDVEKYKNDWLSQLEWILPYTCITALPIKSDINYGPLRYELHHNKIIALVQANRELFRALIDAAEESDFEGKPVFKNFFEIAEFALKLKKF